jgi:molybdenum cofactor synthesis domain-containing protein
MADQTAAILIIGDEILSGKTADENAAFLIRELRELGVALKRILVIPDVTDEIAAAVRDLSAGYDHVFSSGGVGPTHDDLTMEGVARAFGTRVARHPALEQLLRGFYGAKLEERNLRMADVPEGADLIASPDLPWPVVAFKNVYILPGIPIIFRKKFLAIRERFRGAPYHLTCLYVADDEGRIAAHMDRVAASYPEVAVGSYPRIVTDAAAGVEPWRVKITLESKDRAQVERAAAELAALIGERVARVE